MGSRLISLWGPVVVYACLIFALSSQSRVPSVGSDKAAHTVEYAILSGLIVRAQSSGATAGGVARATPRAAFWAWLAASLYGITDEWHQSVVPGRDSSGRDAVADALGAAAGAVLMLAHAELHVRRRVGKQETPEEDRT